MLVYSTCTLAPEENEMIIADFLSSHRDAKIMPIDIGLEKEEWYQQNIDNFDENNFEILEKKCVRILPSPMTE